MNSTSPLQIGDIVRIIGPNWCDSKEKLGAIFQITEETGHGFSTGGHSWYPAASLRKVRIVDEDKLQIGDWVEVTGPDDHGFGHTIGEKFRISLLNRPGAPFPWASDTGRAFYPASSLRKLTSEEVQEHHRIHEGPIFPGQTIGEAAQEFSDEVEKAKDAIRDILAPLVDDRLEIIDQKLESFHDFQMEQNREVGKRLSAIEKRHDEIIDCLRRLANLGHDIVQIVELHEGRFDGIENRLALVEAFQKDQAPYIDDVGSKILDEPPLQTGDYVEVLRDGCGKKKGFIFRIAWIKTEENSIIGPRTYYSANKLPMWTADELRKLSDEEICKRLNERESA